MRQSCSPILHRRKLRLREGSDVPEASWPTLGPGLALREAELLSRDGEGEAWAASPWSQQRSWCAGPGSVSLSTACGVL